MKSYLVILTLLESLIGVSTYGAEGMPSMPVAKPKNTVVIKGNEDFDSKKGFGEQESEIEMMNQMMVEGSGMEGMDMSQMPEHSKEKTTFPPSKPNSK